MLLSRPEEGKRECYISIGGDGCFFVDGGNCPLDLLVRDLEQNGKDQAHLKDDDVIEVRNGEIFCLA